MVTPAQARKRKRAAKVWADKYNLTHKKHPIVIPKGFNWQIGFVGPQARKLVSQIEKINWPNLPTNGQFDTKMLHLLFPPQPVSWGSKAVVVALTQKGVHENPAGSNHGLPCPTCYQAILGLDYQPWCACFVTWALRQVGWNEKGWNQAYVPSWVATAHAGEHGLMTVPNSQVENGIIVCFDWDNDGIADHIGFVTSKIDSAGYFQTIEGNTSHLSNSNGGAVEVRTRHTSDVSCFIRLVPTKV